MRLIDADALPKYTGYALSADEVATAVDNAPTIDAVPRWIPCEERLPEQEEKAYLVYLENGHVCDCKWWCRNLVSLEPTEYWRWDIFDIPQYSRVLAWMQLPKPYAERKDDE